jgi:hypothetical protein
MEHAIAMLANIIGYAVLWVAVCCINGWSVNPFVPY